MRSDVWRHQDHQFGFAPAVIIGAEQRAEYGQVFHHGHAFDALACFFREQACHGQRAAAGQLERGLGAAHLEAGERDRAEGDGTLVRRAR